MRQTVYAFIASSIQISQLIFDISLSYFNRQGFVLHGWDTEYRSIGPSNETIDDRRDSRLVYALQAIVAATIAPCIRPIRWPRCILRWEIKDQELSWGCVILILLQRPDHVIQRWKVTCLILWHFDLELSNWSNPSSRIQCQPHILAVLAIHTRTADMQLIKPHENAICEWIPHRVM